jgi:hypothetical protein
MLASPIYHVHDYHLSQLDERERQGKLSPKICAEVLLFEQHDINDIYFAMKLFT